MRAVVQRVRDCRVRAEGRETGRIESGLLVYLAVGRNDSDRDLEYIVDKVASLRIFPDEQAKMNLSVLQTSRQIMAVSQFTLYGDARQGRRPSFSTAAESDKGRQYFSSFVELLRARGLSVQTGLFAASMDVEYINWGPVTILLDSEKLF
jgi:D-tyrosyl-tRNA(Tyr) deacylase